MEFFFLFGLLLVAVPFVLPIAAWVSSRRTRARLEALEATIVQQRRDLDAAVIALRQLRREPEGTSRPAEPGPAAPAAAPPPVVRPAPGVPPAPVVPPAAPVAKPPASAPADSPSAAAAPAAHAPAVPPAGAGAPAGKPPAAPPRPPAPPRTPPPPPPPPPARPAIDWENLVGAKLAPAAAGIALVIAAIFFLKYSIDAGWLQPPVRVAIGILVSTALLVVCEMKAARRYPSLANAMDAAAIAILFSTFFAAHALWDLIPATATFGLLALVTVVAVLLSVRRESLFIAVLGLLGGFATPALLSTGQNQPIPLFTYLLMLNVGLAWVAYSRGWPVLTWLTLGLTVVYQWGWVFKFLDASTLPLAMGVFLVFPIAAVAGLILNGRGARGAAAGGGFEKSALISSVLPLLFAVYLAAVPGFGQHAVLMFGFLAIVDAGLLAVAIARWQPVMHGVGAVMTLLVTVVWLAMSYEPGDSAMILLGFTPLFVALYLAAPAIGKRFGAELSGAGIRAHYVAPMLLIVFPVLAAIEPTFAAPWPLVGVLAALVLAIAWRAIASRDGALHYIASFFAIATQAVWSANHLTLERLGTAVSIYTIFGVISLAVPIVARRRSRPLQPAWGSGVVQLASLGLLWFLAAGGVAPAALWALALLLAIVNAGLFVESAEGRLPIVSQIGSVLSWVLLMIWWRQAAGAVGVLPSLTVVVGLSLITLAGHAWSVGRQRTATGGDPVRFRHGLYLGLIGHLFLALLASDRQWALPPWPVFGALAAVTLATSAASLWVRVAPLHIGGTIAAGIVLAAWSWSTGSPDWGLTAVLATAAVSAYALAWIPIGNRLGSAPRVAQGACATLFVAEYALLAAVGGGTVPPFAALLAAHVVNLSIVLALTSMNGWRYVAMIAVAPAWLAVAQWQGRSDLETVWPQLLALAGALYAVFVAYPFMTSARTRPERDPYIAAIIASAMAFFAGRQAFEAAGLEWMVGVVPVIEGAALALLLRMLLRLQPPGERDTGRLALVAGAALAFATVAIPLQLEHQWITIGWALEGAALAWLYGRVPHRGLLFSAMALLAVVFARLAFNPEVFLYEPRGTMRIFNWYLYAYLICASAMLIAGWWLAKTKDDLVAGIRASRLLPVAGTVLLFLLLNIEIADYYAVGDTVTFRFGVTVAQDLTYTIGWLVFGMGLLAVGIYMGNRPARIAAVALIAITTFKCFFYDLSSLEGLARIVSFVGLAISLALVSLALQKFVLAKPRSAS